MAQTEPMPTFSPVQSSDWCNYTGHAAAQRQLWQGCMCECMHGHTPSPADLSAVLSTMQFDPHPPRQVGCSPARYAALPPHVEQLCCYAPGKAGLSPLQAGSLQRLPQAWTSHLTQVAAQHALRICPDAPVLSSCQGPMPLDSLMSGRLCPETPVLSSCQGLRTLTSLTLPRTRSRSCAQTPSGSMCRSMMTLCRFVSRRTSLKVRKPSGQAASHTRRSVGKCTLPAEQWLIAEGCMLEEWQSQYVGACLLQSRSCLCCREALGLSVLQRGSRVVQHVRPLA